MLFLFFILTTFGWIYNNLQIFLSLWPLRNHPMWRRFALYALGEFVFGFLALIALVFGYTQQPKYTTGFAISYWVGQSAAFLASFYLKNFLASRRGSEEEQTTPAGHSEPVQKDGDRE